MEKGNTTTPFSSIKTQNELDEELSKFREEHFKNNQIYRAQQKRKNEDIDQNVTKREGAEKQDIHEHLVKQNNIEVDVNNNNEVLSTCKDGTSCPQTNTPNIDNNRPDTANNNEEKRDKSREDKEDQIGNLYSEPNQETKNIDDVDDDLAFDEVDEDSDTVDSAEPEKDVEKERIARINSFRKEFGDDIVQGFTNFDVIDSQKTSTIKVPDIDIFHRKIENQYESYSNTLPVTGNNALLQVDGTFDTDEFAFGTTGLPQVDGYNDANTNDIETDRNDINNNRMSFKEPYLNDSAVGGKRKEDTDDQGNNDGKFSRQDNYDQLWYNKFTLGRKEMSTILRVKNVLCKQSYSTVFLVQATEWPNGRMVDNSPNANQKQKRNQPAYKIDVDQMEPEFGTDLKDELQNGSIASNLLALKVAKKKGTKKNSAQIYKEMAKELRFLRTFRNVDHHGFIIKIYAAFQTRQDLCVLTEFVPGGDLHTVASVKFKRLENAEMVRFHPFFEPYSNDWRLVEDRKIRPPWIPGNKCLTSNLFPKCFDPFFTRQKLQVRPDPKFDEGEWGNGNYHYFQEFKYIGDSFPEFYYEISGSKDYTGHPIFNPIRTGG